MSRFSSKKIEMNKEQKKRYIEDMSTQFDKTESVIVTHYQGLTVTQLDDLRKKMREHGIKFRITNNRITKLAIDPIEGNASPLNPSEFICTRSPSLIFEVACLSKHIFKS